jgi:hypothetical protein
MISEGQIGFIQGLFADLGFPNDPNVRHEYEAAIVGHWVASTKALTMAEARQVIRALQEEKPFEGAPATTLVPDADAPL